MSVWTYLSGVACLLIWAGLLWFSAERLAGRKLAIPGGPARSVSTLLLAVALGLGTAILPGMFGLLSPIAVLGIAAALAVVVFFLVPPGRDREDGPPELRDRPGGLLFLVGSVVGGLAAGAFLARAYERVGTGMTGFDSTWYHGPIAAEFIETGDVFQLHAIAPQFLTWFYPHNSELFHATADMLFGGDLPSLAINILWFGGCLLAGWAIGSGRSSAPLSMAGVALAVGSFAFADQAGEARNDLAGTFFLLGGVGVAAAAVPPGGARSIHIRGVVFVVGLAAGLAAGTKLNFLLPGLVLALGALFLVERPRRKAAILPAIAGFLIGGVFWYFRNLVQAGNPLPWVPGLGPLSLPAPDQARGGRDPGSVLDYLGDPGVIFNSFVPDLVEGLGSAWPLLLLLAVAGFVLCFRRPVDRPLLIGAATGFAALFAWLAGPTSASGPVGDPVGFLSGLRYLVPALAIGLALLGPTIASRSARATRILAVLFLIAAPFTVLEGLGASPSTFVLLVGTTILLGGLLLLVPSAPGRALTAFVTVSLVLLVALGFLIQGRYEERRYASPDFVVPGLARSFVWAQGVEGDSIGTTATRSYPLYGRRFDNRVGFVGVAGPNGGFVRAEDCRQFISSVNGGDYDWVVASLDREGVKRDYPSEVRWLDRDPAAVPLFRDPPTAVFAIEGRLDPERCPGA